VLDKEIAEDLQRCMAELHLDLTNREQLTEEGVLYALMRNDLCIMRVLAAMNEIDHNPQAGLDLLPVDEPG
jgi:hypothetical protein